jgi:hypothetical protein
MKGPFDAPSTVTTRRMQKLIRLHWVQACQHLASGSLNRAIRNLG